MMALNSAAVSRLTQTWEVSEIYMSKNTLLKNVKVQCMNGDGAAPAYFSVETDFN